LDEDGENIHLIAETDADDDEEDDEDEDDDYNEEDEDDDDEEDDIESAMNAFLSSAARRAGSSTGYESSLSSKNFFSGLYGSSGSTTHSTLSGITSGGVYPKLELLINDHVLPTNMTIYQAIKQFGSSGPPVASSDQSMLTENDAENTSLINNAIWSKVHLIHYRIAQSSNTSASSSSTTTAAAATSEVSSKASTSKETDTKRSTRNSITKQQTSSTSSTLPVVSKKQQSNTKNENDSSLDVATDSITNTSSSGLDVSLTNFLNKLTSSKSKLEENINDRSIDSILLLRLLSSVNREWLLMYKDVLSLESIFTFTNNTNTDLATQSSAFLTGMNEFVNIKLTAKANRQLQDPLVVMTGKIHKIIK